MCTELHRYCTEKCSRYFYKFVSSSVSLPEIKYKKIQSDIERKSKHVSQKIQKVMTRWSWNYDDDEEDEINVPIALSAFRDKMMMMMKMWSYIAWSLHAIVACSVCLVG